MKNLDKEDCVYILSCLIESKRKALGFYEKMPMQDKVKNQILQEIANLQYVLQYIEG